MFFFLKVKSGQIHKQRVRETKRQKKKKRHTQREREKQNLRKTQKETHTDKECEKEKERNLVYSHYILAKYKKVIKQ